LTDVRFAGNAFGIGGTDVKLFPLAPHPFTQHQRSALAGVKVEGVMEGVEKIHRKGVAPIASHVPVLLEDLCTLAVHVPHCLFAQLLLFLCDDELEGPQ
jgi:hypothetical protein